MADQNTPGTFIPHDAAAPAPARRDRGGGGLADLIFLIAIVLLVASGALAGAVFLYAQFLNTESSSKLAQLKRAEAAFEPALIQQITRLDDRMHAADVILGTHIAPTAFFKALEGATLQTVSFQTLTLDAQNMQHVNLKMQGIARSVNSIALQADLFSKNGVVTSPIFSNIARQADGVHFDLAAIVNPSAINYAALLAAASGAPPAGQQTTTTAPPQQNPPSPFDSQDQDAGPANSNQ